MTGGELKATDYHKLIFLLCQQTGQNYYDFFPYNFGAYSLVLQQDKGRLTELGYLEADETFRLTSNRHFFRQLDMFTQVGLQAFVNDIGSLRGSELLKLAYSKYPYYAINSLIAESILSPEEYIQVQRLSERTLEPCLFTIGYEGLSIDAYLNRLICHNVRVLVDVRKNPISRKYGFSKNQLQRFVEKLKISYVHMPELGVPSAMRQDLTSEQAYQALFAEYVQKILPNQMDALVRLRDIIIKKGRVALTCFEAAYSSCHRSKIVEYFESDPSFKISIQHL